MKNTVMLKKNYEFKNVLNRGKYFSGKYLEIFLIKNQNKFNMLGVAVSKKIGNSVTRNKIKRLIRENYRLLEEEINLGNNFVILWKKKVESNKATFLNVQEDLKYIFKKANIL